MKVFKFGGASISTAERIKNVGTIISSFDGPLVVVVSALGKTTNALEDVVTTFYKGERKEALELFTAIKKAHTELAGELCDAPVQGLDDLFTEVEWLLHDKPVREFDYYYDQVVCVGELLSSCILSRYLNGAGIENEWMDVRDIIRTDNNFRDAKIDWAFTADRVSSTLLPIFSKKKIIITQGFIGATDENESTTLGREGSDYTAAVFSNMLNAQSQTIWKDVQGVMNADPKLYPAAQWIRELNYREVIEMAYYGAQVIHPKTIKPLQNKNIPLHVKSFTDPGAEGTVIHDTFNGSLPPIIVYKQNQALVQISSNDFSFTNEGLSAEVQKIFGSLKFRQNLTQITAISVLCVVDNHPEKLERFALAASEFFEVSVTKGLTLLTIRHYTDEVLKHLMKEEAILLRQQTPEVIQVVIKD
ncbi:MAG TPA: aspartate kinase [Chitinophagaceae bacterium]|nr:aspartate kinase [Chitinophagaceae bacterium]